jgi:hypothetical protein
VYIQRKLASFNQFNLLEGIYANAVAHEVHRLCVELCCGCQINHPSQRQHDCLMIDEHERWQMYGLQAIGRVNTKRLVWNEFAEVARVLKCGGWATWWMSLDWCLKSRRQRQE